MSRSSQPVRHLLQRLDRVRISGDGWVARCPAHPDSEPSLAVAVGNDGRVLVHCFAGCDAKRIVSAVGLELGDLFDATPDRHDAGGHRHRGVAIARQAGWRAALGVLDREATIVWLAGRHVADGGVLSQDDAHRLDMACERVADARRVLRDR